MACGGEGAPDGARDARLRGESAIGCSGRAAPRRSWVMADVRADCRQPLRGRGRAHAVRPYGRGTGAMRAYGPGTAAALAP